MNNDVDGYISSLPNWKNTNLIIFKELVEKADKSITTEIKWGVPVFIFKGKMIFAMSAFKEHTKYNFIANGALINDDDKLFNNGFDSKKSRGIDLRESEIIDKQKLINLIQKAIDFASK